MIMLNWWTIKGVAIRRAGHCGTSLLEEETPMCFCSSILDTQEGGKLQDFSRNSVKKGDSVIKEADPVRVDQLEEDDTGLVLPLNECWTVLR